MFDINTMIEIFKMLGVIATLFLVLAFAIFMQTKTLTQEEMNDKADAMDEFLYGEKFR